MQQETIREVQMWASSFLKKHHRDPHIIHVLLEHYLQTNYTGLQLRQGEYLDEEIRQSIVEAIEEHIETGIPIQHLIGYEYFYGRKFQVNKHVLIPRFETEELVYHVIQYVNSLPNPSTSIVDVGTGSGVIAATLAIELKESKLYATDISEAALQMAEINCENLKADVTLLQGDFLQPVMNKSIKPKILVSNPPYIDRADQAMMEDTVTKFDPHLALFADKNGLQAYEKILRQIQDIPTIEKAFFEIGYDQKTAVTKLVKLYYPNSDVTSYQDINGKDRIIVVTFAR